ncbi:hypothetical protein Tco_0808693 [Tanacetum coccineum]
MVDVVSGNDWDVQPTEYPKNMDSTYREESSRFCIRRRSRPGLATYKLEGMPQLYFPYSEKERCEREYKLIRQLPKETSTDFMKRFLRLAGFLGAKAGTQEEQAKHFKWELNDFVLDMILNTEFTDVAQVANVARNIKIFRDRLKNEGDNKRDRVGHHIRPSETPSQGSNPRSDDRRDRADNGNVAGMQTYGTNMALTDGVVIDRVVTDMIMVVTDGEMVVRRRGVTKNH